MSDSNWLGILGGFWLGKTLANNNSLSSNSHHTNNPKRQYGNEVGYCQPYVPESEESRARHFVHRYATDGQTIFTEDQYCLFVHRLGVVCVVGQDEDGCNIYDVHPCKKSQFGEIYTNGYFWVDDLTQRSRNKIVEEVSNSLAHQGYPVDKSRFRFLYQFGLMEKAYPETFRYLSAEESYYYWKSLGN
jgi:hypothetical protein